MSTLLTKKHNALIETRQLLGKSRLQISKTIHNEVAEMCHKNKIMEEKLINSRKSLSNLGSILNNHTSPVKDFDATNSTIPATKTKKAPSPEIYYKPVQAKNIQI